MSDTPGQRPFPPPTTPPTQPGWGAQPPGWASHPGQQSPPASAPAPGGRGPGRRWTGFTIAALAVGAVAVVGGAAFAITSLTGDDGAGSPEAAVEALVAAVAEEDLIGVLEALPSSERDALRDGIEGLGEQLQRLGLVSDDLDLGDVGGFDLEVDGLELDREELADGIAAVQITGGTIEGSTIPDEVPIGPVLRDIVEEDFDGEIDVPEEEDEADLADAELELVAVQEGGGWRVSLFYSVAEAIRKSADAEEPDFGEGLEPDGADSPEAAVEEMAEAATELDVERLLELLPPDEMAVVHDYAPLFLDDAEEAAAEARADGLDLSVDDLELVVEGSGGTRFVAVEALAVSGQTADGEVEVSFDGQCFRAVDELDDEEVCAGDETAEGQLFGVFLEDADAVPGVTVVEREGGWYVSPVRTVFDVLITALEALDQDDIEQFGEDLAGVDDEMDLDDFEFEFDDELDVDQGFDFEDDGATAPEPLGSPSPPTGLGTDPTFQPLADACFAGDLAACDRLYQITPIGSPYEAYGSTCGGRVDEDTRGGCVTRGD